MAEKISSRLKEVMARLNKEFGDNSIATLGGRNDITIEAIKTGSVSLDYVFGCGGLPRGRIIEVYGKESSGKSTLALYLVSQVQKQGGTAVWIDAECAFSTDYASKIGVDTSKLLISQPTTGEEGLTIVQKMVSTGEVDILVLDSVASLVPKRELEGNISKEDIALQARMMSKAMRILAGNISKTKTVVIFINQVRDKIGMYKGSPETTPGGRALKFFSSVRLSVKKGENFGKSEVTGNEIIIKATKNKVGMPFRSAKLDLYYSLGIDQISDLFEFGARTGIISRAGATYSFNGKKLGSRVGKEGALEAIKADQKLQEELRDKIIQKASEGVPEVNFEPKNDDLEDESEDDI
jgi:recombination protein RecA